MGTVGLVVLVAACVPGRPDRLVEADAVGVVKAVGSSIDSVRTVEFEDGHTISVPEKSALALNGAGYNQGDLLLFGEDYGRSWYARLGPDQLYGVDGCYWITGVAYDEPGAVIVLSNEWRGVGLRLPKAPDSVVPPDLVNSEGRYGGGEYPTGGFCVDSTGTVFGFGGE